jgi:Ribose/xylose/arabinose/galactoside ABC-type transport systems, permease components
MEKNTTGVKLKISGSREIGVFAVMLALIIIMSIASPVFLTMTNLINVVRQTVEIGIMAVGMTYLIIAGELDLSIGSLFAACAIIGAVLFKDGWNATLVFVIVIIMGIVFGSINGLLVTKARIPSFIVTLGTMKILRSVAYAISNGQSISVFPESATKSWVWWFGGTIGKIPTQVFLMIIIFIIAHIALKRTEYGYQLYATGGNTRAALLSGIKTDKVKLITFIVMGFLCAFAAIISTAYLGSVTTTCGEGREMDAIAAVILGGAALSGGRGSILGTFIGAIIMSIVKNGMVLLSVPVFWQNGFIGIVVIVAVLIDTWMHRADFKR